MNKFISLILFIIFIFSCHKAQKFSEVVKADTLYLPYVGGSSVELDSTIHNNVRDPEYYIYFICPQRGSVELYLIQLTLVDSLNCKPETIKKLTKRVTGELSFQPNKHYDYLLQFWTPDSIPPPVIVSYRIDLHYNL